MKYTATSLVFFSLTLIQSAVIPAGEIGSQCGGFVGIPCNEGLECQVDDVHTADAFGTCVAKVTINGEIGSQCGGFAGFPCNEGLECQVDDKNTADAFGTCVVKVTINGEIGSQCGGFAGFPCNEGLECQVDDVHTADAFGTCVAKVNINGQLGSQCGGFAGFPCNEGLKCQVDDKHTADAFGTCVAIPKGAKGSQCGGFAGLKCNRGLKCVIADKGVADAFEYHSRKLSFYGQTNEQAEKLIQDGTAKKFCSNYDIILVADVNPDARFILKSIIEGNCFIKKLIFITTNRFDFNLFNEDKEMYYELVRKGHYPNKSGAEIIWVQNNPWEAKYCEIKLGGNYQDFTLIRPFGYSNLPEAEPISEEEAQLPAIHDHGFTKVFTKMVLDSGIKVRILPALYGGPSKVAQYKALLFFPYQTSTMKLYENLSQGVVTYVPTPRLLKEMIVIPGFDIDDHKHLANCINSGLKDWFNYIEVYNEDLSRFFYQFDTLEELKVLLSNPDVDPLNVRENGKRYYEEANAISLLKWSKVLGIKHNGM
ncbi:hypothetical protein HK099_000640 [Clydaea vesicula]|uniref:Uncharacterized protein n=1 Tax=Clydaea vesicula TaxID=447962 RepID=A0AAD5Y239_9FUNG|nr:hypothetical protein HK099_000640 [Clydaea vesicula]